MVKRVTIVDIARHVGLSKSTVAYAFSARDCGKVSLRNRQVIAAAAESLGYRTNHAARVLRSGESRTIGILWPSPRSSYYAMMLSSLQALMFESDYVGSFAFWDSKLGQQKATSMVLAQQLDGVITVEPGLLPDGLPFPVVAYYNADPRFDSICHNFAHAASLLFDYLQGLGHRHIGHITSSLGDARSRYFLENLRNRGLPVRDAWIYAQPLGSDNYALGYHGMEQILRAEERPTAVFAYDDQAAIGAMRRISEAGLRIPEEISVIGYADTAGAPYLRPSLTTFAHAESNSCASLLWTCLLRRMADPSLPRQEHLLKPLLIKRESCACVTPKWSLYHAEKKFMSGSSLYVD